MLVLVNQNVFHLYVVQSQHIEIHSFHHDDYYYYYYKNYLIYVMNLILDYFHIMVMIHVHNLFWD